MWPINLSKTFRIGLCSGQIRNPICNFKSKIRFWNPEYTFIKEACHVFNQIKITGRMWSISLLLHIIRLLITKLFTKCINTTANTQWLPNIIKVKGLVLLVSV